MTIVWPFLEALGHPRNPLACSTRIRPPKMFVQRRGRRFLRNGAAGRLNGSTCSRMVVCPWEYLACPQKRTRLLRGQTLRCVGLFYLGFHKPSSISSRTTSRRNPGMMHGSATGLPEVTRRFFTEIDPRPAPASLRVQAVSQFGKGETPEVVTFFARGEVMAACWLATFVTDDFDAVASALRRGALHGDMASAFFAQANSKQSCGWDPSAGSS